jgi:hypothetical protein
MEDILVTKRLGSNRTICLSTLARNQLAEDEEYTGDDFGYFIYEIDHTRRKGGIKVLARVLSVDAALRIIDVLVSAFAVKPDVAVDAPISRCAANTPSKRAKRRSLQSVPQAA